MACSWMQQKNPQLLKGTRGPVLTGDLLDLPVKSSCSCLREHFQKVRKHHKFQMIVLGFGSEFGSERGWICLCSPAVNPAQAVQRNAAEQLSPKSPENLQPSPAKESAGDRAAAACSNRRLCLAALKQTLCCVQLLFNLPSSREIGIYKCITFETGIKY